jgi:hypothetical protein
MRTYIFNNLIFNPGRNYDALIYTVERRGIPPINLLDIRNNLLITDAIKPISLYIPSLDGVVDKDLVANNVFGGFTNYTVSTLIAENNKLLNLSQASALGLTSDNFFNITSTQFIENITNAGQTIICADCADIDKDILGVQRPQGSAWDIGAYEYVASVTYGDVSGDGSIDAYDAALVAKHSVGLITLSPEQQQKAEVSGDGLIDAYDAALIAKRAVGLIDKFPVEQ